VQQTREVKGFISYCHNDLAMFDELRKHLKVFERAYGVTFWADTSIQAGRQWRPEIQQAIDAAQVFLLLVSHNYLASDFISDHEMPAIRKQISATGALAIPVILLQCGWKEEFGNVQAVPTIDGHDKAIADWVPMHDGYNRAREQVASSIKDRFGIVARTTGLADPFTARGQESWLGESEQDDEWSFWPTASKTAVEQERR
jgi:hypothetical protein